MSSEKLYVRLGIEAISEVVRRGRLRWYGHLERKGGDDWVSACRDWGWLGGEVKVGVEKPGRSLSVSRRNGHGIELDEGT